MTNFLGVMDENNLTHFYNQNCVFISRSMHITAHYEISPSHFIILQSSGSNEELHLSLSLGHSVQTSENSVVLRRIKLESNSIHQKITRCYTSQKNSALEQISWCSYPLFKKFILYSNNKCITV